MLFQIKVIDNGKEALVEIESSDIQSVLDALVQEENISHIISIVHIDEENQTKKMWDFVGNLDLLRSLRKNLPFYEEDYVRSIREGKIH